MENYKIKRKTATKIGFLLTFLIILTPVFAVNISLISTQAGIDDIVFHPMSIIQQAQPAVFSGYTVDQIRTAYNLPTVGGNGTTIAVIIAYHTPNIQNYLGNFSKAFNLPLPDINNFEVYKMASNIIVNSSWSLEACLDVEWAHAIAPNAKILLVEAVNANSNSLFSAVQYATSRPDVVAVSMSWGTEEFPKQTTFDSYFSNSNIGFFASSGDDGSIVYYPSSSPKVVAVGGTTLNLDSLGNVISETAWNGSGGGTSQYETIPSYQTNYGLNGTSRYVPDVSYNANSETGIRVYYNDNWYIVGGTSAGAPQWAAIYALGTSANHSNLYAKAKTAYTSYFRDIIVGSTTKYAATIGYDNITGLGSPLTYNFGATVTISPTSGGPLTNITITGTGLSGSSVNISYLNPKNSTWISIINNTQVITGNFSFNFTAPDFQQANPSGDNAQSFDNIIIRVIDNNYRRAYNATAPFEECRRGLVQISNIKANGAFGNNTDFASSVFVKNGDSLQIKGVWFSPGNASIFWDNATIGYGVVDTNGQISTNIIVPPSSLGNHILRIQDTTTTFNVNVTYSPTLTNNYTDFWHTNDFSINLIADLGINEIYYRINNGDIQNVTDNGLPTITVEGSDNTLEYWCIWRPNATAILETVHTYIMGIKLDKTQPVGSISTISPTQSAIVTLSLNAVDNISGVYSMRFSNDSVNWSSWEFYKDTKIWVLENTDGLKTVYVQFMNTAGLVSTYNCEVIFMTPLSPSPQVIIQPTETPTVTPTIIPTITPTQSPSATPSNTEKPTPTPIPELSIGSLIVIFVSISLIMWLLVKKLAKPHLFDIYLKQNTYIISIASFG